MDLGTDARVEFHRLRFESQRVRAEAIRSRIQVTDAFCAMAEADLGQSPDHTRKTLSQIRHSIDELQRHIAEPDHILPAVAAELTELLSELKQRAKLIRKPL